MQKQIDKAIVEVVNALSGLKVYSAAKYLSDKLVVRISSVRQNGKLRAKNQNLQAVLVIGRPNFAQREFIKSCKKAGEPFPVKHVQLKTLK